MTTLFEWLKLFGVIFLLIFLGELPPVKALSDFINDHRRLFFEITIVMTASGALALLCGFVGTGRTYGRPMTHEEYEQLAARTQIIGPGKRFSKARFRGKLAGVVVPETTWSFHDLKESWRSGAWWSDSRQRQKFFITAGGALSALGGFALLAVLVQPPSVKLMLLAAVVYAWFRLTWAFWRA